jgi:hypothetical protein
VLSPRAEAAWPPHPPPDPHPETRCRLQLSPSFELYTSPGAEAERRALVDTGLALARRLGDPGLLAWAARAAWLASWSPQWTEAGLAYTEEGLVAARAAGDRAAEAVALVSIAAMRLELEGPAPWRELRPEFERIAEQDRLPYVLLTVCWIELNLAALRGDRAEAERRAALLWDVSRDCAIPAQEVHAVAGLVLQRAWDPEGLREFVALPGVVDSVNDLPMNWPSVHGFLGRAGLVDELRVRLRTMPYDEPQQTWQTLSAWSYEAEAAHAVGDRALAERCRSTLAPYAGRMSVAGVAGVQGPVDGYLALAARTLGDHEAAGRHAAEARRLATEWGLPEYVAWLDRYEAGWAAEA